jgi:hypothetical protein
MGKYNTIVYIYNATYNSQRDYLLLSSNPHNHHSSTLSLFLSSVLIMELESMTKFLEKKTILVTGATGFLAKGTYTLSFSVWDLVYMLYAVVKAMIKIEFQS